MTEVDSPTIFLFLAYPALRRFDRTSSFYYIFLLHFLSSLEKL